MVDELREEERLRGVLADFRGVVTIDRLRRRIVGASTGRVCEQKSGQKPPRQRAKCHQNGLPRADGLEPRVRSGVIRGSLSISEQGSPG